MLQRIVNITLPLTWLRKGERLKGKVINDSTVSLLPFLIQLSIIASGGYEQNQAMGLRRDILVRKGNTELRRNLSRLWLVAQNDQ